MRQDGERGGCRTVRGLACFGGVSQRVLTALVEYWTRRPVRFWVESELRYPELFQGVCRKNVPVEVGQLRALLVGNVWELDLKIFPPDREPCVMETYEDFLRSGCLCCLLYYDCGDLEVYIRDEPDRAALLALLQNAGVDPQPITEENDGRERMRL